MKPEPVSSSRKNNAVNYNSTILQYSISQSDFRYGLYNEGEIFMICSDYPDHESHFLLVDVLQSRRGVWKTGRNRK